jgi:predicted RNase H-like HicB family nuclease
MTIWNVRANYDPDDQVWYVFDSDIPGLATDGETLERLRERVAAVLPDLLELNAAEIADKCRLDGPHLIHLIAFHESTVPVAA